MRGFYANDVEVMKWLQLKNDEKRRNQEREIRKEKEGRRKERKTEIIHIFFCFTTFSLFFLFFLDVFSHSLLQQL